MPSLIALAAFGIGAALLLLMVIGGFGRRSRGVSSAVSGTGLRVIAGVGGAALIAFGAWRSSVRGDVDEQAAAAVEPAAVLGSSAAASSADRPLADAPAFSLSTPSAAVDASPVIGSLSDSSGSSNSTDASAAETAAAGLPAGQLSETGDSVQIVDMTPLPGTTLKRGVPLTLRLKVAYTLNSADTAVMTFSIAQVRDSAAQCNVAAPDLIDATEVPIERGRHLTDVAIVWSGDTGASTRGKVFEKGYISFVPSFWQRAGNGRRRQFTGYESVCLRFEP